MIKNILLIFIFFNIINSKETLKVLVTFIRHGSRDYWGKIKDAEDLPNPTIGFGQLDELGLRQHYILGKKLYLNNEYFFKNVKPKNIKIYTSSKDRVKNSIFANFRGLFFKKEFYKIPFSYEENNLIFFSDSTIGCSPHKNESYSIQHKILNNIYLKENYFKNYIWTIKNLDLYKKYFKNVKDEDFIKNSYNIIDFLIVLNYSKYDKNEKKLNNNLMIILNDYISYNYNIYLRHRIKINNLELFKNKLINQFDNYFNNIKDDNYYTTFSGHDSNILDIIYLLIPGNFDCVMNYFKFKYSTQNINISNPYECIHPPFYAAVLAWELYNLDDGSNCIKFKYDDKILFLEDNIECLEYSKFKILLNKRLILNNKDLDCN